MNPFGFFVKHRSHKVIAEFAYDMLHDLADRNDDGKIDAEEWKYALGMFSRFRDWVEKKVNKQ